MSRRDKKRRTPATTTASPGDAAPAAAAPVTPLGSLGAMTRTMATEGPPFGERVVAWAEGLAVAVVFALFIKFYVVEAFRIPSSSMEPTLIGSGTLSDKILVAKNEYLFFSEPERWDVAVFKYPNNRARAYIKRLVGMPGDWLLVKDGDVLDAPPDGAGGFQTPRPFPRPLGLVLDTMCYPLFPISAGHAAVLHAGIVPEQPIEEYWAAAPPAPSTSFAFADDRITYAPPSPPPAGEVRDWVRYSHRIDNSLDTSGGIAPGNPAARVGVEDVQLALTARLEAPGTISLGVFTSKVEATCTLDAAAARARLEVVAPPDAEGAAPRPLSPPVEVDLPADAVEQLAGGDGLRLELVHIDFTLRLVVDDVELATTTYPVQPKDLDAGRIQVRFGASTPATFADLYLARDIFYTPAAKNPSVPILAAVGLIGTEELAIDTSAWIPGSFVNRPVQVPPDHYVMLGDNSANSADSRHWHLLGYLDEDGDPRVWEDAPYAAANPMQRDAVPGKTLEMLDIYGRAFVPSRDAALIDPTTKRPILLGSYLVDGRVVMGFHDTTAARDDAGRPRFITYEGEELRPTNLFPLYHHTFVDQEAAKVEGEARGRSFSLVGDELVVDNPDGSHDLLVPNREPGGQPFVPLHVPPGFRAYRTPYMCWSPFVHRQQVLGQALCVFWPGGIVAGKVRGLSRFRYIQ